MHKDIINSVKATVCNVNLTIFLVEILYALKCILMWRGVVHASSESDQRSELKVVH